MASPTQWTWVWVNYGSWWCTGRPSVLWDLGLQRVGHDWATELNWMTTVLGRPFRKVSPKSEEELGQGGEGDDRGWDGWMASPTRWTWVWVNSGSWCWTERPGAAVHGAATSWTGLSDWTELMAMVFWVFLQVYASLYLLRKNVYSVSLPVFNMMAWTFIFILSCMNSLCILGINPLLIYNLQIFSPIL